MARPKRTTPWLDTRDNGIFYAFWYDESARTTRSISLRTRDKDQAELRFGEFLINGRELRKPKGDGVLTVGQVLDGYMDEHVRAKCAAPERNEFAIYPLKQYYGEMPVRDADIAASKAYAAGRAAGRVGGGPGRNKPVGASTIRRELTVLVAAANHAVKNRKPGAVPVDVELPSVGGGRDDEVSYLAHDELEALFAAADNAEGDVGLFLRLLYLTGARRRSIENLTRGQVRWRERRIILKPADKKATKKRQPIVPILKAMEPVVSALLETGGDDRLFQYPDYYRRVRKLARAVGLPEGKQHLHIIRHSRATHLLQDGVSIYDVGKLLGDTATTVDRVYGHHSAESLAARLEM